MDKHMTTKTDAARECAEEIVDLFDLNCKLGEHGPRHNIMVDEVETIKNILAKHFPPSVPVNFIETKIKYWRDKATFNLKAGREITSNTCHAKADALEALIAEAK